MGDPSCPACKRAVPPRLSVTTGDFYCRCPDPDCEFTASTSHEDRDVAVGAFSRLSVTIEEMRNTR